MFMKKTDMKSGIVQGAPNAVADPGFPVGGRRPPGRLRFKNFVCRNERIWTLGGRAPNMPPRSANVQCLILDTNFSQGSRRH